MTKHIRIRFTQIVLTAFIIGMIAPAGYAQSTIVNRGCGTGTLPAQFETWVQSITPAPVKGKGNNVLSVFNIPVIVHVIHNNEALNSSTATTGNNLNSLQIIDQINILNKDFNGLNADTSLTPNVFKSVLGHFQFNFCLAVVNPTGGVLAEPGIERIDRNAKSWNAFPYSQTYMNSTVKPNSIWDPSKYLNIWICPLSGGLLGFATFPNPGNSGLGGFSPPYGSNTTDGLVMLNSAFGSIGTAGSGAYNKGRTATHELGHWVGLRHIWGDGVCATDYCADTPPAQAANYGCPTHPYNVSGCTGNTTGEMTMNFMDYTNDACMYMFTNDQKNRAQLIMTNSPLRAGLLTSTVCNLPNVTDEIGVLFVMSPTYSQVVNCSNSITPQVQLHNFGSNTVTTATYSYNIDGVNTQTATWTGTLLPGTSATVTLPQMSNIINGTHKFNIGFYAPNGNTDPYLLNNVNNQYFSVQNSFTLSAAHSGSVCPFNTATLTATGGASGFTWQPGGSTGTQVTVNPSVTTIYTLSGSTGTCINTRTLSLTVGPQSNFTVQSMVVCAGTQTQVSITGSSCTYTMMPGNLLTPFTASTTTGFTVVGNCSNLCAATKTGTITVLPQPPVVITVAPSGSLCAGGTATVTATGGSGYTWNTGSTSNQIVVSPTANTIYTVTGIGGGCSKTTTALVSVGANSLTISVVTIPSVACAGKPLIVQASGGSTYTWNTGATSSSISLVPSANTSFTVFGINGSCTASNVIGINVIANPLVNIISSSPANTVCSGGIITLSATGASSYSWNNGMSTPVISLTPTLSSVQTVTGSSNGCSSTQTIAVNVSGSGLGLSVAASGTQVCAGGAVLLTGSGVSNYTWSNGSNNSSISVSPTVTTTYILTGESGGCTGSASITINVSPATSVTLTAVPSNSLCAGQTATLYATGNYSTYIWSSGASTTSIVVDETPLTYSVTGTNNGGGCIGKNTISIFNVPSPVSTLTSSNTLCGNPCMGTVNAVTSGGVPPYTYSLNSGNCTTLPCTNLCEDLYVLTTTDSQGCRSVNYFSIECLPNTLVERDLEALIVFPNPTSDLITIKYSSAFSYQIFNEIGQLILTGECNSEKQEIVTENLSDGIYLLHVKTSKGHHIQKIVKE